MSIIQPFIVPRRYQSSLSQGQIFVYRGDLEHPYAPGNKWHKLKYHLLEAQTRQAKFIATFGGPYSNHLHAFAQTLHTHQTFKALAVIRGELHPQLTLTLRDMVSNNVELWPTLRFDYKRGLNADVVKQINALYGDVYWIPEGGGGVLGAQGCLDWAKSIEALGNQYDAWVVSAGTGTTAAGLLSHPQPVDLHVISALKGAEQQRADILAQALRLRQLEKLKTTYNATGESDLDGRLFFHSDAHEGGFAKHSGPLLEFIDECNAVNPDLPLDPIYTCKTLFYVMKQWQKGGWPYRRTLLIHTGGLQGWRGYV
ncbi:D-cysteine desulfhydrase [Marinomonas spartinae]|uniref:D-cysteine desulfhydrase n=1 Tax=Marinomonas spartinae TaxID=1792290 RepID=A0A1A8TLJ4_9GAMM|nr:cysteine desulfhydrase [Marinomonas spartinae]SBS34506.1 D-cysteine desulfhydrase [Marinomonas spartinae]